MNPEIESSLGLAVRRHLDNPDGSAFADVSSGLEYLLGGLWEARRLMPRLEFDGLAHAVFDVLPPDGLRVIGLMYEIESQAVDWFSADLHLIPGTRVLESYELRYGVKDLTPPPPADRLRFERNVEAARSGEWKHIFRKPGMERSGSSS